MKNYFENLEGEKRDIAVEEYRKLLLKNECGVSVDFEFINKLIISRWSLPALDHIKKKAWLSKTKNNRTYVVAKNANFKYGVFLISVKNWAEVAKVGFDNYYDAFNHFENVVKSKKQ